MGRTNAVIKDLLADDQVHHHHELSAAAAVGRMHAWARAVCLDLNPAERPEPCVCPITQPSFEIDDHSNNDVHVMEHPSDEEIQEADSGWLTKELKRRGYIKPPFTLFDVNGKHSRASSLFRPCVYMSSLHPAADQFLLPRAPRAAQAKAPLAWTRTALTSQTPHVTR